ncbi:DUF6491 family protein [Rhodanobacter sp. DHG33]|uniref:DUF6491 family protein n=1 Tax=Rhodanobacter sp. DHG33 TaxID=2775921 RepID=UPI001785AEB8|nr:DUF6491 family protein [Rhodanobacter sp. DHG33]MBD8899207.1 hypothetical protein [Rhodanobacter sp. DHG33]
MKPVTAGLLALSLAAIAATASAQTKTQAPAYTPLRPVSDCLRTDRITEWHLVNSRTITVRNGPNRFLVKLQASCPQLSYGPPTLRFGSSKANQGTAPFSICGEAGESVRSTQPPSCPIQSVRPIDKATFDKISAHAKRNGSGADQPTKP